MSDALRRYEAPAGKHWGLECRGKGLASPFSTMMARSRNSGGGLYEEEFGCPADAFLDGAMVHLDSLNACRGNNENTGRVLSNSFVSDVTIFQAWSCPTLMATFAMPRP